MFALFFNTEGNANTANGASALINNTTGSANTASEIAALFFNPQGSANTGNGAFALQNNTTGNNNTAIGYGALLANTSGTQNTALGAFAGLDVNTADNVICISVPGDNVSDSCYIGNIWAQPGGPQAVYVNSNGKLGAQVSSRRFKDRIKPMEKASEAIYGLKPVSFRYKQEIEPTCPLSFGLIAEDVEKVDPDLVVRDREGKPYIVRYDQVNAMLLNEFLKEHAEVQRLEAALEAVNERLKEQEAKIEKVRGQMDSNRSAAQVVVNNR